MKQRRILILFAHPAFQKSRAQRQLLAAVRDLEAVTVNDLYEEYPDFNIDVAREQQLLLAHDIVVFQHPFYWYSSPAILKEWQDLVLEYGFAYGGDGSALAGKIALTAISSGGGLDAYGKDGFNNFTIRQFLLPFEQTARLCGMTYLPPFVAHGLHRNPEPEVIESFAGAVIGPFVLGLVGAEGQDVMHFAEFGVVMMLFLVGLELQPSLLWRLRGPILGIGGLQVLITTVVLGAIGLYFGLDWRVALAIGMILALSSTAIVLQTLNEKGLMKTSAGQTCFSVLLFQDIAVIPMLALLPMLATTSAGHGADTAGHGGGIGALLPWQQALIVAGLVGGIVVVGRLLMRPIFRFIASTQLREIFTATGLLLVIGIALAMDMVGLSPALGTFLAGVVLADSEYRHELESDIEPFKGLLLGLFFISVGASIDFNLLFGQPGLIGGLVALLVLVKLLLLFGLGRVFKLPYSQDFLFAFALAQGGEFAFVLFSFATANEVLAPAVANPLVVAVALSMAVTPLLMIINEKLIQPLFSGKKENREADVIDEENAVIIAGFGRFGHIVGRLLKANGISATVLDLDPEQIEVLRRFGLKVFYGDAGRLDLLHAAGAHQARLLLLAIDDEERANAIATEVKHHFPNLTILARANSLHHAYDLLRKGADQVFRETMDSALEMGVEALRQMGFRSYQAHRAARIFKRHEHKTMNEVFDLWDRDADHVERVREHMSELDRMMQSDRSDFDESRDHSWEAASADDHSFGDDVSSADAADDDDRPPDNEEETKD